MLERFLHENYLYGLVAGPVASRVYGDHEKRISRGRRVAHRLSDNTLFIIHAIATGVVANIAYDALKAIVNRVVVRRTRASLSPLDAIVSESQYLELQREYSPKKAPAISVERRLRHTYELVVDFGPRDSDTVLVTRRPQKSSSSVRPGHRRKPARKTRRPRAGQ